MVVQAPGSRWFALIMRLRSRDEYIVHAWGSLGWVALGFGLYGLLVSETPFPLDQPIFSAALLTIGVIVCVVEHRALARIRRSPDR